MRSRIAVTALALIFAGCGHSSCGPGASPAGSSISNSATVPAPPACQLLTLDQASAALGAGTLKQSQSTPTGCMWYLTDGATYMTLAYDSFASANAARSGYGADKQRETNAQYSTSTRAEAGIGDEAFSAFYSNYLNGFGRELLITLRGTYVITINLVARGGDAALRTRVESIARDAVGKI